MSHGQQSVPSSSYFGGHQRRAYRHRHDDLHQQQPTWETTPRHTHASTHAHTHAHTHTGTPLNTQPRTSSHDYTTTTFASSSHIVDNRSSSSSFAVSRFDSQLYQQQQQQQHFPSLSSTTVLQSSAPSNLLAPTTGAASAAARAQEGPDIDNNKFSNRSYPPPSQDTAAASHQASSHHHARPSVQARQFSDVAAYSRSREEDSRDSELPVSSSSLNPDPSFGNHHRYRRRTQGHDSPSPPPPSEVFHNFPPSYLPNAPAPPHHRSASYQPRYSYPPVSYEHYSQNPALQQSAGLAYDTTSPEQRARQLGYTNSVRTNSTTTPGADNLGDCAVGGGIAGIAYGVASANERISGLEAIRAIGQGNRLSEPGGRRDYSERSGHDMDRMREDNPYVPEPRGYAARNSGPPMAARGAIRNSYTGSRALAVGPTPAHSAPEPPRVYDNYEAPRSQAPNPLPMEQLTPPRQQADPFGSKASLAPSYPEDAFSGGFTPPRHSHGFSAAPVAGGAAMGAAAGAAAGVLHPSGGYSEDPFQRRSQLLEGGMEHFDPNDIADDGDDFPPPPQGRRSVLSFNSNNRSRSSFNGAPPAAGIATGGAVAATGAGIGAAIGGLASRNASGKYSAVAQAAEYNPDTEKNEELQDEKTRKRRLFILIAIIAFVVIGAVVGGAVGGVLSSRQRAAGNSNSDNEGTLDANSASIKSLMNDPNLHRVFPGMAYTPLNAQYPDCLTNPPSQNNVTKDMAVMSQLTNTIRMYGTDCNQTEMVLEAIKLLNIKDMKVWMAVWLNNNDTTNTRGLDEMHSLLDRYGGDPFSGVILGNEVLFRKDMTEQQLTQVIVDTRGNFTAKNVDLPVAVADLGDNWTAELAEQVDVVMSNVHPFFGGVPAAQGAGWAWDFWQSHDVSLTAGNTTKKQVISEIGWPSGGGQDCGSDTAPCSTPGAGAVAGIDEMNTFMDTFVCQSLTNATDYFWFEAFDEPWKVVFNTPGKEWEDKWGLFDSNRNLKQGLKIPSCPGQSIPAAT